jgi:ribosomal peptide maturation radical SAM protein 1
MSGNADLASGPTDLAEDCRATFDYDSLLRPADALIIVPPFADVGVPSYAAHLLQACAREAGFSVRVLYANMTLAALIGSKVNQTICFNTGADMRIGDRFFSAAAYGLPALGHHADRLEPAYVRTCFKRGHVPWSELLRLEPVAAHWADTVAAAVTEKGYKVVGCTTMFQQTSASVALLSRIKRIRPEVLTIIGGANCEGEMAEGIASLCPWIDHIFSGESEVAFVEFLRNALAGESPQSQIINSAPRTDLDALPTPNYAEFFEQLEQALPQKAKTRRVSIPFETSRGCWWGQKHHCTFCGLNGLGMSFRQKSPERVIRQLKTLVEEHQTKDIMMSDNILPHTYLKSLIPRLKDEVPGLYLFYEVKANLTLPQLLSMKEAGIRELQPGIEALSTSLLRRMKKGVSAPQNVAFLRYARSVQFEYVAWNLLHSFPGDEPRDYEETLQLLPLLRHLCPPTGTWSLSIDRFSPYFDHPSQYGISNLRPYAAYAGVYPASAALEKVAYHFDGDYQSAARENQDIVSSLKAEIEAWRAAWFSEDREQPILFVQRLSEHAFLLHDTRGLDGTEEVQFLSRDEAKLVLAGRPLPASEAAGWVFERKLAVELDGVYVPLAVAEPALLLEFESEAAESKTGAGSIPTQHFVPLHRTKASPVG